MKYKNITKGILRFRAHNIKLEKELFIVKPGKEIETGVNIKVKGLEKVSEKEKTKRPLRGKEK